MTERERLVKAVASAESHIRTFREMEATERGRIRAGGPYPVDEAHSFRMADHYAGRVREAESMLSSARAELARATPRDLLA